MKTMIRLMTCAAVAALSLETANANLNVHSDGSDGALVVTNNIVIDLSQAVTGNWDMENTANAGKGIYDPNQWCVVFKYSSVVVQNGATVTFKNHASRAPVVWLVSGDVTNNGTISLDGQNGLPAPGLAQPGPGGFRGSSGYYAFGADATAGFGPGGGCLGFHDYQGDRSAGGSYGTAGQAPFTGWPASAPYGNPSDIRLLGGSGGGGSSSSTIGGGAGGGGILIACAGTITISGAVRANGGTSTSVGGYVSAGGSGGAIRLVGETFSGAGMVQAIGGTGANAGGIGRISIERVNSTSTTTNIIPSPHVVSLTSGTAPQIWLPTNGPTVRIVSIQGNAAPADPRAEFGAIGADLVLPRVTNVTVVVETSYVEYEGAASQVTVRATPRSNGSFTEAAATLTQVLNEDQMVARWTAKVPVSDGYSAIQVKVVRP